MTARRRPLPIGTRVSECFDLGDALLTRLVAARKAEDHAGFKLRIHLVNELVD
jgi:hypothetical protein